MEATTPKFKIYRDYKEFPFYNYSRIIHTGDFLYMIKGYESGDEINADSKMMEKAFNDLIREFMMANNASTEEIENHANYIISTIELSKIIIVIGFIENQEKTNELLLKVGVTENDDEEFLNELLDGIMIERSTDLIKQKKYLIQKKALHENNVAKYKELIDKKDSKEPESAEKNDVDKMFINVCIGLEISPPDKRTVSLYDFAVMTDRLIEKSKEFEKLNKK